MAVRFSEGCRNAATGRVGGSSAGAGTSTAGGESCSAESRGCLSGARNVSRSPATSTYPRARWCGRRSGGRGGPDESARLGDDGGTARRRGGGDPGGSGSGRGESQEQVRGHIPDEAALRNR